MKNSPQSQHPTPFLPEREHYTQALRRKAYEDAVGPLQSAAVKDDAEAMGLLGTLFMLGHGVKKDAHEASRWFHQGALQGDVSSQTAWGLCLAGGVGTSVNQADAVYWLSIAGQAGSTVAREVLGWLIQRHPSLVGAQCNDAQATEIVRRTRAGASGTRGSGWAACLSPIPDHHERS